MVEIDENKKMKDEDKLILKPEQKLKINDSMQTKPEQCGTKFYGYGSVNEFLRYNNSKQKYKKHSQSFSASPTTIVRESDKLLVKNIEQMLNTEPTPSEHESVQERIISDEEPKAIDRTIDNSKGNHSASEANRSKTGDEEKSSL